MLGSNRVPAGETASDSKFRVWATSPACSMPTLVLGLSRPEEMGYPCMTTSVYGGEGIGGWHGGTRSYLPDALQVRAALA
jgi:hypothetical protein